MQEVFLEEGIPEESVEYLKTNPGGVFADEFMRGRFGWEPIRKQTRVVAIPYFLPFHPNSDDPQVVSKNDIFIAFSAGNVDGDVRSPDAKKDAMITIAERRDFYNAKHFSWHEPTRRDKKNEIDIEYYTNLMEDVLPTDKVAVVTLAIRGKDGVRPDLGIINCGDAKKWCFTKVYSEKELKDNPSIGTSQASVAIGSIAFYIRQLEGVSATDTMDIMRSCAVDLGKVGVDREYGWGEPSVQCAKVKNKEVQTLASSAKVAQQNTGSILTKGTSPESDDISSSPILSVFSPDEEIENRDRRRGLLCP